MRLALTPRLHHGSLNLRVQSSLYGPTATVTATWTNAHYAGDRVSSGTAGLQEAINFANSKGSGGTVIVDAAWTTQGGTTAILECCDSAGQWHSADHGQPRRLWSNTADAYGSGSECAGAYTAKCRRSTGFGSGRWQRNCGRSPGSRVAGSADCGIYLCIR